VYGREPEEIAMEHGTGSDDDVVLGAVLDTLLPPVGDLAGAGGLGLTTEFRRGAELAPHLGTPAIALLRDVTVDFVSADPSERESRLRALETAHPDAFAAVLNLAYNAYYSDPRVLRRIEAVTGYAARPPQPDGYELPPFDESVLARIRERAPFWREA